MPTKSTISVYPKPARNQEMNEIMKDCRGKEAVVELRNANGRLLFSKSIHPEDDLAELVLHPNEITLREGMYLVSVRTGTEFRSERLVITN